jgi:outer membrane protein
MLNNIFKIVLELNMFKKITFVALLFYSSTAGAGNPILEKYIQEALQNNLALKQQDFSLQKSLASLKEARGLFFPSINISARYSRAGGGRQIDMPIGDLVNPIYQTLNEILQQDRFPTNIPNQTVPFLREKEHDTKVSLYQPIFQPEILYNYKIRENISDIQKANKQVYIRQLVADVKEAYFTYLKTIQIVDLLNNTKDLLDENLRLSKALFSNQKATKEIVYRAEADLSNLEQKISDAIKNEDLARSYFNLLLNRSFTDKIEEYPEEDLPNTDLPDLESAEQKALNDREELTQLYQAIEVAENSTKLSKSNFFPKIFAAVNYGFQGTEYKFTKDDDYWMASGVLQWNLFNGYQDKARIQQTTLEKKRLESQLEEAKRKIVLQVKETFQNMTVAQKSLQSASDRVKSSRKSFDIIDNKYQLGMSPQIEYLDARNTYIEAEINHIITKYDYFIYQAKFERASAIYLIKEY